MKTFFSVKRFFQAIAGFILSMGISAQSLAAAPDVILVLDTTGSTGALLPNWKANIEAQFINPFKALNPNTRFALVSHRDFPFSPYGGSGDFPYRVETPLNTNTVGLMAALNALTIGNGGDGPESQLEALRQAIGGAGLDLNGDGDYLDTGDIAPINLGINAAAPQVFVFHFTSPLSYHNHPTFEPNYPYAGVVNSPADLNDVLDEVDNFCPSGTATLPSGGSAPVVVPVGCMVFTLTPNALFRFKADGTEYSDMLYFDQQTGEAISGFKAPSATNPAEELASRTNGDILAVGRNLEGLKEAITGVIEDTRMCKKGQEPLELPTGYYCVNIR